jgi:deazaflavin-dependent oxidoreductase (nitroreductase family)
VKERQMAGRRAPRWLGRVNAVNRFLLRGGIGPPAQRLLTIAGRQSGKPRTTPVALLAFEGAAYLVAGFDGADWVKNARAAGRGELRRGRQAEIVNLLEVDAAQRVPILRHFAQQVRGGRSFLTVAKDAPDQAYLAASSRHPVFRVTPVSRVTPVVQAGNGAPPS